MSLGVTLACMLALASSPAARADGDPASDYLYGQAAYFPYQPAITAADQGKIGKALADGRSHGYQLKVAIIASPVDLGSVPEMFGKPQAYADFLDREILAFHRGDLLVVMPGGFGVAGPNAAKAKKALQGAQTASAAPGPLGKAAIDGIIRVAKAAGHPIKTQSSSGTGPDKSGGGGAWIAIVIAAGAVLAVAGALGARRRGGTGEEPA